MNQQFRYGENDIFFSKRSKRWRGFPPAGCFTMFNLWSSFTCSCIYVMYYYTLFMYVFIYYVVYLMYVYLYSFINSCHLLICLYIYIYMQLQKYRTWSVQKWGMPATALQSLIHHPGTCVAGPAVPQASCNLVKIGRRVSPKVFSEKKYLTGPCCSSLEQFDCSLGVFGKAQRPHDLNSKVPLFECGGQSSIFGHILS